MCFVNRDQVIRSLLLISYLKTVLLLLMNMGLEKCEAKMTVWIYVRKRPKVLFDGLLNKCCCCLSLKVGDFEISVVSSFQATYSQFQNCLETPSVYELYKVILHLRNHRILCFSLFKHEPILK